jgi:putative Ca2+/H+ antiporter (TMEM165/GDT1 family)
MDIWPLLITFIIIAAAEFGDKTQLLTLGFATKFPLWKVIGAVTAATAVLMAIAVMFGGVINYYIPEFYLQLIAGIIFIIFGLWILRGDEEDKEEEKTTVIKSPFIFVFSAFFLAELGDKTQLATLALSAKYGTPFQVWLGATLGMAGVNILAAVLGSWIKKFVSEKTIKWIGATIFIVFGVVTLWTLVIR